MLINLDKKLNTLNRILVEKNLKLSVCESCTGGLLSKICTDFSGSSSWFAGGYVTYSNELKQVIGVKIETLQKYGAVSKNVAMEMSAATLKSTKTDVCLSITGIAGPNGGTKTKPLGLVYIGIKKNNKIIIFKNLFKQKKRLAIQKATVKRTLEIIKSLI